MSAPDPPRHRWVVGAVKIPNWARDIAHDVLPDDDAWAERGYRDVIGSDSDHPDGMARFPYGAEVSYSVELTDEEAAQFATASNLRYLEEDKLNWPARHVARPTGTQPVPYLSTLNWLRTTTVDLRRWHGQDVRVAVLDQGTTQAVRDAMGLTLVARTITGSATVGPGQELVRPEFEHGCLVVGNAVPAGGQVLDCIIIEPEGGAFDSAMAAGIRWGVDNGAKVINLSFAGTPGEVPSQVLQDACAYARDNGGVQVVCAAGNDDAANISSPASASRLFTGVHSAVAFDEATDRRALFSNHASDASGCSAGVDVVSFDIYGGLVRWNGTSAAAPHMAQMMARALTGGQFTPQQVGTAFKNNTRDTGAGAAEQGGGAYDLQRALAALGAVPATPTSASVGTPTHLATVGGSQAVGAWTHSPVSGIQVDDLQIVILVSDSGARLVVPAGWTVLTDAVYFGGWEISEGISVGPTRLRVLAAPYTLAQPDPVRFAWGNGGWNSALGVVNIQSAGGLDPEQFAPLVKFGTSGSVSTVSALPASTNDLQVCVFSQRHPTASTGTLSLPSGLTQRGFWRPSATGVGYTLLIATANLTSGARTPTYTSTSNDSTGTWASMTLTIPGAAQPIAPVTQTELAGPPGGFMPLLPHA